MLFGNDSAENDELLYECEVFPGSIDRTKQIVTGRWGVGKTAYLLLSNADLDRALLDADHSLDRVWRIDERSITASVLITEYHKSQYPQEFRRSLESMWRAEIIRRATIILANLAPHYENPSGPHWKFIHRAAKARGVSTSIWSQISHALKIVTGGDETRVDSIDALQGEFAELFTDAAYRCVQRCLSDIKGFPLQPVVAIEPIDTPTSALEGDVHVAQELVTALLNVFVAHFQPSLHQKLYVILSLPWHRYVSDEIDFPQKLPSYTTKLHWGSLDLRQFINRRIAWEFRRVGRHFAPSGTRDEWSTLFDSTVRNVHCTPSFDEDSFSYVLRHTQHRPRQLQQIARRAVELCSATLGRNSDDVLRGRNGIVVHGSHIAQATSAAAIFLTDNVITEAGRRFPNFRSIVDTLKGIAVPFKIEDLRGRVSKVSTVDIPTLVDMLYRFGLLGIQIRGCGKDSLKAILPVETRKIDTNSKGQMYERHYFFEYLWTDGTGGFELSQRYSNQPDLDVSLVLHPAAYEYLLPGKVTQEYPIGV